MVMVWALRLQRQTETGSLELGLCLGELETNLGDIYPGLGALLAGAEVLVAGGVRRGRSGSGLITSPHPEPLIQC